MVLVTSQGVVQVKMIMQQDEKIDKMMKPVPIMIAKVTELFLKRLIEKSGEEWRDDDVSPVLTLKHLIAAIQKDEK